MSLLDRIREDAQRIITDTNGFAVPILFTTPGGSISVTAKGIAVKHSTTINDLGQIVKGKVARVNVSEAALATAGYPVRDGTTNVALKDHRVTWTDSSGTTYTYIIEQVLPSRTVGNIVCILGDYTTGSSPRRVEGWKVCKVRANIVVTPDDSTQTLDNGDVIPLQYALNSDGTLTISYLTSVTGITVLTPFMLVGVPITNEPYSNGTFDNSIYGGFNIGNDVAFNASLPVYAV